MCRFFSVFQAFLVSSSDNARDKQADGQTRHAQRRSQEFDLGGYKWVNETKQPHIIPYIYRYTPIATPLVMRPIRTVESLLQMCYCTLIDFTTGQSP